MAELTGNRKSGNFRSKPTQTQEYERDANIFIVHGHDTLARIELKDYLQNTLGFPAPVILAELPDCGRTIVNSAILVAPSVSPATLTPLSPLIWLMILMFKVPPPIKACPPNSFRRLHFSAISFLYPGHSPVYFPAQMLKQTA